MKTQSLKINSIFRSAFWVMGTIFVTIVFGWGTSHAESIGSPSEQLVAVEQNRLIVSWSAGSVSWKSVENGLVPIIDQFETASQPGAAQLPFRAISFAIPADSKIETSVVTAQAIQLNRAGDVAMAPKPAGIVRDANNNVIGGDYQTAFLEPTHHFKTVEVEEIGTMGGIRLGRAVFYPITMQDGNWVFTQQASVEIVFKATRAVPSLNLPLKNSPMANILSQEVVNPNHLIPNQQGMPQRQHLRVPATAQAIIEIGGEGMAQLTYQDLVDFQLDPEQFNPNTLQITHAGQPAPLLWMGDSDDQFEPGESVRFFAPKNNSRWSNTTRFLIKSGDTPRIDMGARSGASNGPSAPLQQRSMFEENQIYSPDCLCGQLPFGRDGDRWMWHQLSRPGNPITAVEAILNQPDSNHPATVSISMLGMSSTVAPLDHHVAVSLNGTHLGNLQWDGQTAHEQTLGIPVGLLQGTNQVELTLVESSIPVDSVWLDAIHFDYATNQAASHPSQTLYGAPQPSSYSLPIDLGTDLAIYDVTVPASPLLLTGLQRSESSVSWGDGGASDRAYAIVPADSYLTPSSMTTSRGLSLNSASEIDYIMIAPQAFIDSGELEPLITHREGKGWRVGLESAEEIYTAFGDGYPQPEAIQTYLAWAYHAWEASPQMVLLVGDGSTDPKHYLATSPISRIPPFLATVDPWMGETAADNRFVTVDGDDNLPDMMLGRLPVNTIEELKQTVSKIIRYETTPTASRWNTHSMWIADNAGQSRMFEAFSSELIDYFINSPFYGNRFYLSPDGANLSAVQQNVVKHWQRGEGLVMYMGHASRHQWAAERLFHIDDVSSLQNQEQLPFVMHLSCLTGSFHSAHLTALDEQLVRQPDGGAVAVWGSSGLGVATGHHHLAAGALNSLFKQQEPTLGIATTAGKIRLATRGPEHMIMLDTFNLLGDPATQLNLEVIDVNAHTVHLPIIWR